MAGEERAALQPPQSLWLPLQLPATRRIWPCRELTKCDPCPESKCSTRTRCYSSSYLGKAKSMQQKRNLEDPNCATRVSREKLCRLLFLAGCLLCPHVLTKLCKIYQIYQSELFSGGEEHFLQDQAVQRRGLSARIRTSAQLSSASSSASILKGRVYLPLLS